MRPWRRTVAIFTRSENVSFPPYSAPHKHEDARYLPVFFRNLRPIFRGRRGGCGGPAQHRRHSRRRSGHRRHVGLSPRSGCADAPPRSSRGGRDAVLPHARQCHCVFAYARRADERPLRGPRRRARPHPYRSGKYVGLFRSQGTDDRESLARGRLSHRDHRQVEPRPHRARHA